MRGPAGKGHPFHETGLKQFLVPGMFFEEMGIKYLGPVDGHNIGQLMRVLGCKARGGGGDRPRGDEKRQGFGPAERMPVKISRGRAV